MSQYKVVEYSARERREYELAATTLMEAVSAALQRERNGGGDDGCVNVRVLGPDGMAVVVAYVGSRDYRG